MACLISVKKKGLNVNCLSAIKKQSNLAERRGVNFQGSYDAAFSVNEQSGVFAQEHHQSQQDAAGIWSHYFISVSFSPFISSSVFFYPSMSPMHSFITTNKLQIRMPVTVTTNTTVLEAVFKPHQANTDTSWL